MAVLRDSTFLGFFLRCVAESELSKRIELLDSFYRLLAKNESDPNLKTLLTLPHAIQLIEFSMFEPALLSFILFLVFSSLTICPCFSLL